jgi:hypothetical protein
LHGDLLFGAAICADALGVCLDAKKAEWRVLQNDFNREENGYSAHASRRRMGSFRERRNRGAASSLACAFGMTKAAPSSFELRGQIECRRSGRRQAATMSGPVAV